ncbi:TetR/AcrR family transcriptional regulator [Laceyella putida]|uniref:TetR/AcrR family transcriptional regulator n=1 Tax=Laceyella putida TaxID=110101 RepID=A0ABW2RJ50_9BACL
MEAYQKIPADKREKIFQATIKEFADKGYEQASTNQIVQEADISKGLLFHYFGNKKGLFLSTFHYSIERVRAAVVPPMEELSPDFFERQLQFARLKLQLFMKHPLEYRFLLTAYDRVPEEIAIEIKQWKETVRGVNHQLMWEGVDFSRFRKDLPIERLIKWVMVSLEAVGEQWLPRLLAEPDKGLSLLDHSIKDLEEILDILKLGVYER